MNYNNVLINAILNKYTLDEIKYYDAPRIGYNYELGKLFDKFIEEYKKIENCNCNLNGEYFLSGIKRNLCDGENHQIIGAEIIEMMENNIQLRNSFQNLIDSIESLP